MCAREFVSEKCIPHLLKWFGHVTSMRKGRIKDRCESLKCAEEFDSVAVWSLYLVTGVRVMKLGKAKVQYQDDKW